MMVNTTNDIRNTFLDYFVKNDHELVKSASLVPSDDPTLLFTNAGMVPFKNVFTGRQNLPYTRAVSSQKCARAGGKHNDLENVGYTARHHTFFEMLGNFSFGDYFKDHAIELAWKLLTKEYGIPTEKLLVTVYHNDDEAHTLWKKIANLPDDKIIRISTDDNFWSMGDTGPCGPCSEIFYDHGEKVAGGVPGSSKQDGDRFVEIWNLVFMQFDQTADDRRMILNKPSIDTGMGLERLSAVLQGKHDNYDIDMMRNIIEASASIFDDDPDGLYKTDFRIIADHLRSSSFLIADGVLPSNEGRGYVLRRILRRAIRQGPFAAIDDPNLYKIVSAVVKEMGEAFPELVENQSLIEQTIKDEEVKFKKTLKRGLKLLSKETAKIGRHELLSGEVAFKLYDTFGFPFDLTEDILRQDNRKVDVNGFEEAMKRQRQASRSDRYDKK